MEFLYIVKNCVNVWIQVWIEWPLDQELLNMNYSWTPESEEVIP